MLKFFHCILLTAAIMATPFYAAGCFAAGKNASAGTPLKVYDGFSVLPLPAPWVEVPGKQKKFVEFGRPDTQDYRHTTFAIIQISPPCPVGSRMPLEKVLQIMKEREEKGSTRTKDTVFTGRIAKRNGLDVIEYEMTSLDIGSKHIKKSDDGKHMRMYHRGFCGYTRDWRFFDVFISERFPGKDTPESIEKNKIFLDAVQISD